MKKLNYKSIIFNIVEAIIVFCIGLLIVKCSIKNMIIVIAIFVYTREKIGGAKHYKNPIKCMIWSAILINTLFAVSNIDIFIGIGVSILAGIAMSKGGDIAIFEYNNDENKKKYKEMKKIVNKYKDDKIVKEFEKIVKLFDTTYKDRFKVSLYEVYRMYFLESATFKEIKKELEIYDNHGIIKALDMVFISFNTYMINNNKFDIIENKEGLEI